MLNRQDVLGPHSLSALSRVVCADLQQRSDAVSGLAMQGGAEASLNALSKAGRKWDFTSMMTAACLASIQIYVSPPACFGGSGCASTPSRDRHLCRSLVPEDTECMQPQSSLKTIIHFKPTGTPACRVTWRCLQRPTWQLPTPCQVRSLRSSPSPATQHILKALACGVVPHSSLACGVLVVALEALDCIALDAK